VYAHSPLADRKDVELMIPDYGKITVDVSIGGSFYEVHETEKSVRAVAR
jgi:proline racemase